MNPTHFFLTRFGVPIPQPETYLQALAHITDKDPAEIVRDYCPADLFQLSFLDHVEMNKGCFDKSCADCWQSKYKGEKPQCLITTHC